MITPRYSKTGRSDADGASAAVAPTGAGARAVGDGAATAGATAPAATIAARATTAAVATRRLRRGAGARVLTGDLHRFLTGGLVADRAPRARRRLVAVSPHQPRAGQRDDAHY
ncbi:hypothetical protein A0J59_20585 [Cellulosimicrobium sp. I38E]|nr:hypothetical protein A0J59_20585 [Cellulosimicrobium sp. I38E]